MLMSSTVVLTYELTAVLPRSPDETEIVTYMYMHVFEQDLVMPSV